jgi:hypothetical protein
MKKSTHPSVFIIESNLESLTVKNVANNFWHIFQTNGSGRIAEYSDESLDVKLKELKDKGWKIRQPKGRFIR